MRLIPAIDTTPAVVRVAQTRGGRLTICLVFWALLSGLGVDYTFGPAVPVLLTVGAALCAFSGGHRLKVLSLVTLFFILAFPGLYTTGMAEELARREGLHLTPQDFGWLNDFSFGATYLVGAVLVFAIRRWPGFRHPFIALVGGLGTLATLGHSSLLHGLPLVVLWAVFERITISIAFLGYAILDQRSNLRTSYFEQMGTFYCFWGTGTALALGKGTVYLRQTEAKTSEQLAVTQLKALKLLLSCVLLNYLLDAGLWLVKPYVPSFKEAFKLQLAGHPVAVWQAWLCLVVGLFKRIMKFAIFGNGSIAVARLAGFRLLQFCYKPYEATTVAQFWNRINYYYKELLVDFFFLPTFIHCFRTRKRLRLVVATVMAAGVGNVLIHVAFSAQTVALVDPVSLFLYQQSNCFCYLVLALGIALSQQSQKGRRFNLIGIGLFYLLLFIFDELFPEQPLGEHMRFLLHLFGLN